MKLCSEQILLRKAFSLVEVVTALIILGLVCSSMLVIYDRAMVSAADSSLQMNAFEVARNNMETLLLESSVEQTAEYGISERYPGVQWQTTVESFYEPVTSQMWIQAVCSAGYMDSAGEEQKVELTHWLTNVSAEDVRQILDEAERDLEAEQILETAEEAAGFAGVDLATIEQWLASGMRMTANGSYLKSELELYKQTGGSPTALDRQSQADGTEPIDEPGPEESIDPDKSPIDLDKIPPELRAIFEQLLSRDRD